MGVWEITSTYAQSPNKYLLICVRTLCKEYPPSVIDGVSFLVCPTLSVCGRKQELNNSCYILPSFPIDSLPFFFHSKLGQLALLPFLLVITCSPAYAPTGILLIYPLHKILDAHRFLFLVSYVLGILNNMFFCCWLAYTPSHIVEKYQSRGTFPAGSLRRWESLDGPWLFLLSLPFSFVFNRIHEILNAVNITQNWSCVSTWRVSHRPSNWQVFFSIWAQGSALGTVGVQPPMIW